ncbi:UNVERIFIED_CONTAM: hypothetical protein PYX00_010378 [Menopon gallinae]|uniref:Uncharacterized protein n=1 Tax=Menopon gallinae TaxID=328185 RepID=A0AAW2HF86_9NEOP
METVRASELLIIPEETTPPGLQRLWSRRLTSSQLIEDDLFEELFPPAQDFDDVPLKSRACSPSHDIWDSSDVDSDQESPPKDEDSLPLMCLDASALGDIPARYVIPSLPNHEFPVIGVFVDPRIVPGFKYKVRVLPDLDNPLKTYYLFDGRALRLLSIGRGYSRRLTFEPDQNTSLNDNENYFWADSRTDGFGFELQTINVGDKFMIHDASHIVAGTIEIISVQEPQEEVSQKTGKDGIIEKRARVKAMGKVEWFDDSGTTILLPMSGIAVCVKQKNRDKASVTRIISVTIGSSHRKRGFTLTPGVKTNWRRTNVSGAAIGDVPAKYTITGLESFELPVVGTYVDPRIVPGFRYKVRVAGSKGRLFNGQALRLNSIGMGYAKRITFECDANNLNESQNHFWSDSNPDGYGFEPVAVDAGMQFLIHGCGQILGHAQIFRVDAPQREVKQDIMKTTLGPSVTKHIEIDVTCHVTLSSQDAYDKVMRVTGTALVQKDVKSRTGRLIRIQNIGLDSQINLLFVREHEELVFLPNF